VDDHELLLAQLAKEFTERLRRGESPDIEQYAQRHPELAERLRQLFPTLVLMERPAGDEAEASPESPGGVSRLTWYIVAAILLALLFAFAAPRAAPMVGLSDHALGGLLDTIELGGTVFLRLLKMIVVPLVMLSVMSGVIGVGDARRLGRPGAYTLAYFLATTVLAALIGLLLANLVRPGARAFPARQSAAAGGTSPAQGAGSGSESPTDAPQAPTTLAEALKQLVLMVFTDNLFGAMAEGNLLPLILFSVIFAGMLTTTGRQAETISRVITSANRALLDFVMLLMKVAPIAIFCLVAAQFGRAMVAGEFGETFRSLAAYMLVVLAGLALHALVALPLILFLFTRRHPYRFFLQMSEAMLTAFSTASSSATLPVSMECAEKRAGVSRRAVQFVLPLGATINMDGTALYQACAAVFIAQASGVSLGPLEQLTIVATATLASIGTAGVPQAGLVALVIVLSAVGLSGKGLALVLSVDWLVDRFRTTVNIFGDAVGAAVVQESFGT